MVQYNFFIHCAALPDDIRRQLNADSVSQCQSVDVVFVDFAETADVYSSVYQSYCHIVWVVSTPAKLQSQHTVETNCAAFACHSNPTGCW